MMMNHETTVGGNELKSIFLFKEFAEYSVEMCDTCERKPVYRHQFHLIYLLSFEILFQLFVFFILNILSNGNK